MEDQKDKKEATEKEINLEKWSKKLDETARKAFEEWKEDNPIPGKEIPKESK